MSLTLDAALQEARDRDLARATRALLRRPLLRRGADAAAFRLVRRHATELRDWFDQNTGWRLHVDTEVARLFKLADPDAGGTHPAREPRSQLPFGRRRYVLLCLALSVLERADAQITLGRLAEGIIVAADDERLATAGVHFELSGREERSDLVAVVRVLLQLGALARVAGDEETFVREAGDVLYDVERHALAVLISAPRGPSTIAPHDFDARLRELTAEPEPHSEDLRTRGDPPPAHPATARRTGRLLRRALRRRVCVPHLAALRADQADLRADRPRPRNPRRRDRDGRPSRRADRRADARGWHRWSRCTADRGVPRSSCGGRAVRLPGQRATHAGAPARERASGVLAAQHPRSGRRDRTRGARAGAALGAASRPPDR